MSDQETVVWHTTIGHGPERVIALHGWFGDHRAYAALFDSLDVERFTYAFVDYRGYGHSRDLAGAYSIEQVARDALALADHLGWKTFHVIGHSMGGKAAQKVAIDGGSRIKSLVAITPVPAPAMPVDDATLGFFSGVCDSDETALALIGGSVGDRLSKVWMRHLLAGARATAKPEAFRSYMQSFIHDDLSARAETVTIPILALAGEHDNGVRAEIVQAVFPHLFSNADVTVEILKNSGHYPMDEIPVYLTTRIEAFLLAAAKRAG
ncbi:pimeloyl-ACP methyl ester carboxylesterase [Beijerinckia sp. GAS462]|nr:pimeloyl-ACP methyl ester carboxylesterase [Beijerinckia sp. GAS462]SEC89176.1 Pimeloyl-ACP methyl ester carboxylesterase [Beijerinckia sp. 28-YEA-48]